MPYPIHQFLDQYAYEPLKMKLLHIRFYFIDHPSVEKWFVVLVLGWFAWYYGKRLHEALTFKRIRTVSLSKWPRIYMRKKRGGAKEYMLCLKRYDRVNDANWNSIIWKSILRDTIQPFGLLILFLTGLAWFFGLMVPEFGEWFSGYVSNLVVIGISSFVLGTFFVSQKLANLVTRRTTRIYFGESNIRIRHGGLVMGKNHGWNPLGYQDESVRFRAIVSSYTTEIEIQIEDDHMVKHVELCNMVDADKRMKTMYAVHAILEMIRKDILRKKASTRTAIVEEKRVRSRVDIFGSWLQKVLRNFFKTKPVK